MPEFLGLLACEKVIVDNFGNPSIITVMQNLSFEPPPNQPIPPNAVAPKEWAVFTFWWPTQDDTDRDFRQTLEVRFPDSTIFQTAHLDFKFKKDEPQYNIMSIIGIPISQLGRLAITVWLEYEGKQLTEKKSCFVTIRTGRPVLRPSASPS